MGNKECAHERRTRRILNVEKEYSRQLERIHCWKIQQLHMIYKDFENEIKAATKPELIKTKLGVLFA